MDKNSNYFILSGLISFSLFFIIITLFIMMMFTNKKVELYALNKDKFISISIVTPKKKSKATSQLSSAPTAAKSISHDINVNDLFSKVWTRKISTKPKEKKVNSKRIEEIAKKISRIDKNHINKISDKIKKSDFKESNKKENQLSTANEVNEYLAKIQAIVYQYFNVPPNSEGNSVKTVIELDPLGRVIDFRILNYSANAALNHEADKIKDRLKNVIFPKNPLNRSTKTIVVLISKE
jgi:protein TonB